MGELAKLKDGVLGYMGFNNKYTLDALIEPANYWTWITVGDSWASRMHPNFCKPLKGYLLIVGESEIVPAWEEGGFSIGFGDVKYSDHGYADAGGAPAPDLIVGRIIGDSAAALTKPIQASIGVHQSSSGYAFGRDNATLISGAGLGTFVSDINDMASILGSEFTVNKMHWKDYFPVKEPFQRDFQPDDGFAVGAVYGDDSAEIIIADASADRIFIYDRDGSLIYAFDRTFDGGDGLAVGYVMGSGRGQIIHADLSHDYVYVTDLEENTPGNIEAVVVDSFEASFDQGDFLAVGDLQGDSREDILIGDVSLNQVFIRDLNATTWSWFNRELEASDNLAVGDILGGVKDEVVIADRSANKILVYDAKGKLQASKEFKNVTIGSKTMTWLEYIDFDKKLWQDVGGSALAVGQLYPWPSAKDSGKEEILLAPAENYRHIFVYWWYADKKVLLDTGAIPFDFDGSNALATGDIGHYIRTQDEVLVADGDSFSPDYIRMFDTNNWVSRVHQALPDFTKDADLMYWSGHGNSHGWDDGIDSYWHGSLFPLQFNNHNPVVLGASCQTGYYEDGTLEDKNIAESFLGSGAAVYIGATQSSHGGEDTEATEKLFTDWKASQSIGEAFTKLEQDMWTSYAKNVHDDWWFWVWEYNLYGDPKFGRIAAPSGTEASTPPSTLQIEVPEYTVNVDHLGNGLDYVGIPGGRVWVERGQLRVPFYSTAITYPQGYEIQDVVLTERSGLVTDTGLHIPMTAVTVTPSICDPVPYSGTVGGWFPEEEYHWEVMENADGSTILNIVMYPLQYNPLTTDARFYGNYSFDINWTVSPLTVTSSATDKDAYEQGETVAVDIALSNSGEGQDAIVSAVIKRYGSGEIVDGLLLTTLGGLGGEASFSPQWDTTGFEPGAYYVEVTVEDTAGTLLDRRTEVFQVGIASGEVTHFSAMPRYFDVGDTISASLTFQNTGTVDLSGTALISVRDEAGAVVEEFAHDIADLSPGNSIQFDDIWDTSGAEEGSYTLVGYVAYISMTTDPVFASVSTGRAEVSLYLPIICKNHS